MAFTTITGASGAPTTYTGTDGVDLITLVNPGASDLQAEANNDVINVALAGQNGSTVNTASNQSLRGGQGDDVFSITGGNLISSFIAGNLGNDTFTGSVIASTVQGGQGNDTLTLAGSNGGAFVNGNLGDDTLTAATLSAAYTSSSLLGGQGNDAITLGGNTNTASGVLAEGNLGDDTITVLALGAGSAGVSAIGGSGNDTITTAAAGIATFIDGGEGNDTLTTDAVANAGTVVAGEGVDTITVSAGGFGKTIDITETIQLQDTVTFSDPRVGGTLAAQGITANATNTNAYSITNIDVVTGAYAGASATQKDLFNVTGTAAVSTATLNTASTATIGSQTITLGTIGGGGNTTFTLANGATASVTDNASLAAVVQFLTAQDLGAAGASVAFNGTISGTSALFVYSQQTANQADAGAATDGFTLTQFNGTYNGIEATVSATSGLLFFA